MNIILVRHGETVENAQDIIMGHHGGTLSAKGIQQANSTAEALKDEPFEQAWSSDLERCIDTAKLIMEKHPLITLNLTPALREVNYGEFQGRPGSEIRTFFDKQGGYTKHSKAPGGESGLDMSKRVIEFVNQLFVKYPEQNILLVTHNGPIETIRQSVEKTPFVADATNASIKKFKILKPLELYHE